MKKLVHLYETKFPTDEDKINFFTHTTLIFGILSAAGYIFLRI
jgi:hypothetical protein